MTDDHNVVEDQETSSTGFWYLGVAYWAVIRVVAEELLGCDVSFYGIMLGAVSAGAIGGTPVTLNSKIELASMNCTRSSIREDIRRGLATPFQY
ncbi:hypothetical protein GGI64_004081 [Rhizobium leguminosarum]|uniref:Uncharacterized protein n=1 Tax=Rhizobium leguminosarum TaxID=384 RepID=A0A7Z0E1P6_RHILE|nr:hypothetical protein [Rhizobium leguminosarum]